ncbi:hypothetical protein AB0392_04170 [Nonomuraea angiospora]|uniref:hypothetical protein n=1 Tax=Nonomuraea angiospora TaxID=46172 RepID=UPI00344CE31C
MGLPEHLDPANDSLPVWTKRYLDLAVRRVRSPGVTWPPPRYAPSRTSWTITNGGCRA